MKAIEYIRLIGKEFKDTSDDELMLWIEMVRPMVISEIPEKATISPAAADSMALRPRPVNSYRATTLAFCWRLGSW